MNIGLRPVLAHGHFPARRRCGPVIANGRLGPMITNLRLGAVIADLRLGPWIGAVISNLRPGSVGERGRGGEERPRGESEGCTREATRHSSR